MLFLCVTIQHFGMQKSCLTPATIKALVSLDEDCISRTHVNFYSKINAKNEQLSIYKGQLKINMYKMLI